MVMVHFHCRYRPQLRQISTEDFAPTRTTLLLMMHLSKALLLAIPAFLSSLVMAAPDGTKTSMVPGAVSDRRRWHCSRIVANHYPAFLNRHTALNVQMKIISNMTAHTRGVLQPMESEFRFLSSKYEI